MFAAIVGTLVTTISVSATCQGGTCNEGDAQVLLQAQLHAHHEQMVSHAQKALPEISGATLPTGSTGGDPWDDYSQNGDAAWVPTEIVVKHGSRVDSISFTYKGGATTSHGGGGGGADPTFYIDPAKEYINKVKIVGTQRLSGIQFFLNNGRVSQATTGDSNGNIGDDKDPNPGTLWVYASPDSGKQCGLDYCNTYPDLQNAFCGGAQCASDAESQSCLNHWEEYGRNEARNPNPEACAQESGYAIYSFYGRAGSESDALGFYYGLSPDAAACKNLPITSVTGQWEYQTSTNGALTQSLQTGTQHTETTTNTEQWGYEVGGTVSQGYKIPMVGGGSVSVSSKYSSTQSQAYADAFTSSTVTTYSETFSVGGSLWAWVFTTVDPCGSSRTMREYVMTRNTYETPCCSPGWAVDAYSQFGDCAGGSPNLCDEEQQQSANYNQPMVGTTYIAPKSAIR